MIEQLEFELAYFKATVQHINHYAMETPKVDMLKKPNQTLL